MCRCVLCRLVGVSCSRRRVFARRPPHWAWRVLHTKARAKTGRGACASAKRAGRGMQAGVCTCPPTTAVSLLTTNGGVIAGLRSQLNSKKIWVVSFSFHAHWASKSSIAQPDAAAEARCAEYTRNAACSSKNRSLIAVHMRASVAWSSPDRTRAMYCSAIFSQSLSFLLPDPANKASLLQRMRTRDWTARTESPCCLD